MKQLFAVLSVAAVLGPAVPSTFAASGDEKAFRFGGFVSESQGSMVRDQRGVDVALDTGVGARFALEYRFTGRSALQWNLAFARTKFIFNEPGGRTPQTESGIDTGSIGMLYVFHPAPGRSVDFYFGPGVELVWYGNVEDLPGQEKEGVQPSFQAVAGLDVTPWATTSSA